MRPKALLIGLDGATFTILDPLMARGVMPFLNGFIARGVRAPLRTVLPPLTPPGWTSLMTGKRPGQHGVFDFFQKQAPDSEYVRLTSSEDIHCQTFWTLASAHGRRVLALNFPLTFPAPAVDGCVVPGGWMPWRQLRLGCHPAGLFDRLKTLPSFNPRELALDMALEEKTVEGCAEAEYADWVELHIRRERRWLDVARYLMREDPADLVGIVFDGIDKLQHLCWRFLDPSCLPAQPSAWEQQIIGLCEAYFRQLDEIIAELVDLSGPEATIVLASDHGAGPTSDIFCVNTWLEQQGYLAWAGNSQPQVDAVPQLGIRNLVSHVSQLDWARTVAYAATPSSQGIHVVGRRPDTGAELDPAERQRIRDRLAEALLQLRHPDDGRAVVEEVWTREAGFAGPHQALAPDLTIMLRDGGVVSISRSDSPFKRRAAPAGSHRWEGVFMAAGPGLHAGIALDELSILDVAPLLLHSLDLPVPDDLAGRVPVEAFEPTELRRRPLRTVAGLEPVLAGASATAPGMTADEEALILRRLSALGYIE